MKNSAIIEKINLFRNKFYLNLIIKGILLSIFFSINGFLLIVFLEHLVWFDSKFRQFIFWGFCISSLIFIIYNIIIPFLKIYSFGNIISNKQAANTFMSIQRMFDGVFSANEKQRTNRVITNGIISKKKSEKQIK